MKVCIESQEDGTFSVYEDGAAPAPDAAQPGADPAAMPAEPQGQTAATVDEALELARGMLAGTGENSAEALFTNGGADQAGAMKQGFDKARGQPL
jgi:hypothetical protein